jgi:hypothetical protein
VPPEWRELLEAIVAGMPRLQGALCVGLSDVFDAPDPGWDSDVRERLAFAMHCCRCCPALLDCARWVGALPRDKKPLGVDRRPSRSSRRTAA